MSVERISVYVVTENLVEHGRHCPSALRWHLVLVTGTCRITMLAKADLYKSNYTKGNNTNPKTLTLQNHSKSVDQDTVDSRYLEVKGTL